MSKANVYNTIKGVDSFLQAGYPAQLRLIEVEEGGGLLLTDPSEYVLGYRDPYGSAHYPLVATIAVNATNEAAGPGSEFWTPTLDILIAIQHSQPAELEKNLLYYTDALINLLSSDESIGGVCDVSYVNGIQWFHGALEAKNQAIVIVTINLQKEIAA
jgi:hypothetical protein